MDPKTKLGDGCAIKLLLTVRAEGCLNENELYEIGRTILLVVQEASEGGPNGIAQMRQELYEKHGVTFFLSTVREL